MISNTRNGGPNIGPPVRCGVLRYLPEEAAAKEQELALGLSVNGENLGIGKVVAQEYAGCLRENTPGLRRHRISHGRSHQEQRATGLINSARR